MWVYSDTAKSNIVTMKMWPVIFFTMLIFILLINYMQDMVKLAPTTLSGVEDEWAWWQEQEQEQLQRRRRVVETCATLGTTLRAESKDFLYDPESNLLWCRNAKVGWTVLPAYVTYGEFVTCFLDLWNNHMNLSQI